MKRIDKARKEAEKRKKANKSEDLVQIVTPNRLESKVLSKYNFQFQAMFLDKY